LGVYLGVKKTPNNKIRNNKSQNHNNVKSNPQVGQPLSIHEIPNQAFLFIFKNFGIRSIRFTLKINLQSDRVTTIEPPTFLVFVKYPTITDTFTEKNSFVISYTKSGSVKLSVKIFHVKNRLMNKEASSLFLKFFC